MGISRKRFWFRLQPFIKNKRIWIILDNKLVQATNTKTCVPNLRNLVINSDHKSIIGYKHSTKIIHEPQTYNGSTTNEILAYLLLLGTSFYTDENKSSNLVLGAKINNYPRLVQPWWSSEYLSFPVEIHLYYPVYESLTQPHCDRKADEQIVYNHLFVICEDVVLAGCGDNIHLQCFSIYWFNLKLAV